jgi:Flp pilus assembly protein TadD
VALSKAIEALEPLARRPGATSDTLALFGRTQLLTGDIARAEATLWQASLAMPIRLESLLWHADAAERLGRLNLARESLRRWTILAPDSHPERSAVFERSGDLATRLGDPFGAAWAFERATLGSASSARIWAKLAGAQLNNRDTTAARASIDRGRTLFPGDPALSALQRRLR